MARLGNVDEERRRNPEAGRMGGSNFVATHRAETEQLRQMNPGGGVSRGLGGGAGVGSSGIGNTGLQDKTTPAAPTGTTRGGGGGYTPNPYEAQANALFQQLMNRGPFKYDLQGDMLYRQYADQYRQMGRQAMMDTMGTAAGLTGGYASSNAQLVGNQAYQGYLGQLNAMVPEFYDRAYQVWMNEGQDLQNRYELARSRAAAHGGGSGSGNKTTTQGTEEGLADVTAGSDGTGGTLVNAFNWSAPGFTPTYTFDQLNAAAATGLQSAATQGLAPQVETNLAEQWRRWLASQRGE